jgi:isopropylmalate/isohomocitrate dehydrogenase-like protein
MKRICVLGGDGIGPEVAENAVKVLKALPLKLEFVDGDIGYDCYLKHGSSLPDETIKKVEQSDATLFGAVTTPPNIPNYRSPIIRLRKHFDLYANVRPVKTWPHESSRKNIDMVIVRENTEDLYAGIERVEDGGNRAISEMVITRLGSEKIIKHAFELARKHGYKKVTVVHKANVLRETCGLFLRVAHEISKHYPEIEMNDMLVDACAMQLIKSPESFQVIVTTNMFGDILSDEASMLVGGLGIAYSGNIGTKAGVFEPVHGSAPKYVGQDKVNPTACIMAAKMMLDFIGHHKEGAAVEEALVKTMNQKILTYDLGGSAKASEFTDAVIKNLKV